MDIDLIFEKATRMRNAAFALASFDRYREMLPDLKSIRSRTIFVDGIADADEMKHYLGQAMTQEMPHVVRAAEALAREDIETCRNVIFYEVSKQAHVDG